MLTAEQRRDLLRQVGQDHRLRVLVETGTNDGGTPWELQNDFDRIYTIELGTRAFQLAEKRFAKLPHITCLHGDSAVVLPQVINKLTGPALFWLDAHFSGGDTARGNTDTPALEELEAIFRSSFNHVILIDDARIFKGDHFQGVRDHDWPHLDEIRRSAAWNGYRFELADDIIRLLPS